MASILDLLKAKGIDPSQLSSSMPSEDPSQSIDQSAMPPASPFPMPGPVVDKPIESPAPVSPEMLGLNQPNSSPLTKVPAGPMPASAPPSDDKEEDGQPSSEVAGLFSHNRSDNDAVAQKAAMQNSLDKGFTNNTVQGLKDAQDKARSDIADNNMMRAVASISGGLMGLGKNTSAPDLKGNNAFYDGLDAQANQGVKDFTARGEQEKNDPDSAASVGARAFAAPLLAKLGLKMPENMSYASMEKFNPQLTKLYDAQEARQAKSEDLKYKYDMLNEIKKQGATSKQADLSDKLGKNLRDDLDPNKARGGNLAKSQAMVNAADRIDALANQFPDGNIPKTQTVELATAVAAMISGGSPQSQHQIDMMVPDTIKGAGADAISKWITGEPEGRQQQAFLKMLKETSNREREVAHNQVLSAQLQRVAAHNKLRTIDPDNYNQILNSYGIDPATADEFIKNKGKLSAKSSSPKSDENLTTSSDGSSGKIKVSNGTETLMIDPNDEDHAKADGYTRVK